MFTGYPTCLTVWEPIPLPFKLMLETGDQFARSPNNTFNDTDCETTFRGPRISFFAHTAPLDIKFHPRTGDAWIPFHGSWNRDDPVGYTLSYVPFDKHMQPVPKKNDMNATVDVLWNKDNKLCPVECFRPTGVAIDARGRVWVTSDHTGEVFVVTPPEAYLNGTQVLVKPSKGYGVSIASGSISMGGLLMLYALGAGGWSTFLVLTHACMVAGQFFWLDSLVFLSISPARIKAYYHFLHILAVKAS